MLSRFCFNLTFNEIVWIRKKHASKNFFRYVIQCFDKAFQATYIWCIDKHSIYAIHFWQRKKFKKFTNFCSKLISTRKDCKFHCCTSLIIHNLKQFKLTILSIYFKVYRQYFNSKFLKQFNSQSNIWFKIV